MRNIPLISALVVALFLAACTETKTEYWPDGKKKSEIEMNDGQYEGQSSYWYENGKLQTTCTYKENKPDGHFRSYYPSGVLQEELTYRMGILEGPARSFFDNGHPSVSAFYQNGKLHGRYLTWYPDKTVKIEGQYADGTHDGTWLYYDAGGNTIGIGEFNRGNGVQKAFYSNGVLRQVTYYKQDVKDGSETFYHPDGRVEKVMEYSGGQLVTRKPGG